jgi:hypothetical protein
MLAVIAACNTLGQASDHEIAARFAPVFYQALGDKPRSDYITNFDYDGDWRGDNNWENVDNKKFPLRGYVYYAISETRTHYFIHYAVFHPRDYKGGTNRGIILSELIRVGAAAAGENDPTGLAKTATVAHENDMEGALVVIEKNADPSRSRPVFVETLQHNNFNTYIEPEAKGSFQKFKAEAGRVLLYVEPKGHGVHAYTGEKQTGRKLLIYRYTGKADDPEKVKKGPVGYELLPIATTLWQRATAASKDKPTAFGASHDFGEITISLIQAGGVASKKINLGALGSAFLGDSGGLNMARPPWGWFDQNRRQDPLGLWFFDPATVVKRDFKLPDSFPTAYTRPPFWAEAK